MEMTKLSTLIKRGGIDMVRLDMSYALPQNETIADYCGEYADRYVEFAHKTADRLYEAYSADTDRFKRYRHRPKLMTLKLTHDAAEDDTVRVNIELVTVGMLYRVTHIWKRVRSTVMLVSVQSESENLHR